jgi:adenylosuccinate lyase
MPSFDGMLETALHVVDEMGVYEAVIAKELERFLPFLATTTLLMESVRRGAGREAAHEAIKEHAVAAALAMRQANTGSNLVDLLGADERIPLDATDIRDILEHCDAFVGMAGNQVDTFVEDVSRLCSRYPEAAQITKGRLL